MPSQSQAPSPSPPRPPAAAANPPAPTVTTIHALGDDLLREIFLRLPSLPSLVRAALTCRTFLAAVRSSPAFRRRFRSLHQPPLLGFFFESIGEDVPSFSPIRRRSDPDIAAAVRGADVFLTKVPYHEDASPGWKIEECRGGCLLLINWSTDQIAVYNPITRALDLFPTPPDDISNGCHGKFCYMDFFLLYSDQIPDSFRVVASCHDKARVRASVFSSDTREWQILPWSVTAPAQPSGKKHWLKSGTQVNGNLYWAHAKQDYMVALNTATLQFFFIDLLEHLKGQGHLYKLGGAKDGKLCMVTVVEFALCTWFRRADDNGAEKWMIDNVIPLEGEILQATEIPEDELSDHGLKVNAVIDGIVYMSILGEHALPSWFLSFCLETRKLEKLLHRTFDNRVFPYIMGWPSLLIGDDIDIALDSGGPV